MKTFSQFLLALFRSRNACNWRGPPTGPDAVDSTREYLFLSLHCSCRFLSRHFCLAFLLSEPTLNSSSHSNTHSIDFICSTVRSSSLWPVTRDAVLEITRRISMRPLILYFNLIRGQTCRQHHRVNGHLDLKMLTFNTCFYRLAK